MIVVLTVKVIVVVIAVVIQVVISVVTMVVFSSDCGSGYIEASVVMMAYL